MLKLVSTSVTIFLLCGPALADPLPSSTAQYNVTLTVSATGTPRQYSLDVIEDHCGSIDFDHATQRDDIKICAHPAAAGVRLEIEWRTREGESQLRATASALVARGNHVEIASAGAKLQVALR